MHTCVQLRFNMQAIWPVHKSNLLSLLKYVTSILLSYKEGTDYFGHTLSALCCKNSIERLVSYNWIWKFSEIYLFLSNISMDVEMLFFIYTTQINSTIEDITDSCHISQSFSSKAHPLLREIKLKVLTKNLSYSPQYHFHLTDILNV